MTAKLPTPIPQIPVSDLERAIAFYQLRLGFTLDWKHENLIAGVSRHEARLFLEQVTGEPLHPVRVWFNLDSASEVEALHREWVGAGVPMVSAPEQKPWGLYEFTASDGDGNSYRVFHDTETPKRQQAWSGITWDWHDARRSGAARGSSYLDTAQTARCDRPAIPLRSSRWRSGTVIRRDSYRRRAPISRPCPPRDRRSRRPGQNRI